MSSVFFLTLIRYEACKVQPSAFILARSRLAKFTNGCVLCSSNPIEFTKSKHVLDTSTCSRIFYSNSLSSLVSILRGKVFAKLAIDLYEYKEHVLKCLILNA